MGPSHQHGSINVFDPGVRDDFLPAGEESQGRVHELEQCDFRRRGDVVVGLLFEGEGEVCGACEAGAERGLKDIIG